VEAWIVWLIVAVLLAASEAASGALLMIMFAGGAFAATIAAAVGVGTVGSAAVFAIVSVALIAFVRPVAKKHLYQAPLQRSGTAALVGTEAVVLETVSGADGRIKLAGEIWSARSFDDSATYAPGEKVHVFEIKGATAVVG
jgi:membrane protein implicated in regulation of membrane protease activity